MQITPGNHELGANYSFLNFRTKMPLYNTSANHYFSYSVGKIHFIFLNFEFRDLKNDVDSSLITWLTNDLLVANSSRAQRPWIVIVTHYPIYCSADCKVYFTRYKKLDQLFYNYRVDLILSAHVHYWERYLFLLSII